MHCHSLSLFHYFVKFLILFCLFWRYSPHWARASSFTRFLDNTQRRTTVGRTPLDEWSVRRRELYLTKHDNHNRQTSKPPVGFEPTLSRRGAADLHLRPHGEWNRRQHNEQSANVARKAAVSFQNQVSWYDGANDGGLNTELTSCSYSVIFGATTSEENRSWPCSEGW